MSKELLNLIENADPSDSAMLDEIDCRFDCYLKGYEYEDRYPEKDGEELLAYWCEGAITKRCYSMKYTRSRDASMSIETPSVFIWVMPVGNGTMYSPYHELYGSMIITKWRGYDKGALLRTENLAYLHGKIQALQYERGEHE